MRSSRSEGLKRSTRAEIAADYAATLEKACRPDEALDTYRRVIELKPEVGRYHCRLAVLLERTGRTE